MNDVSQLKNIPQELKFNALWCGWKLTEKGKVPFNLITGQLAKSNDPSTFTSYPVLLKYIHNYLKFDDNGKQLGGIGLGILRGFSAIDIDNCVDDYGNISDMANDIIEYCKSYTELSPSKHGIRIIFKTQTLIDKNDYYIQNHTNGLEIYISDNTNKYVTITGNRLYDKYDLVQEIDIQYILDKYMRKNVFDINKVLKKDEKLNELWNSVAPGSHSNESELDMALCCKLAYYLKNDEKEIEKYFKQSPFYLSKDELHKKKWETKDYILRTIGSAIRLVGSAVANKAEIISRKYELNDTGNAKRFVEQFGDILRYNVDNNIWMIWNGNYWEYDVKKRIKEYVEIMAEQMLYESNSETDINLKTRILRNIDHIYSTGGKDALLKESQHFIGIPIINNELDRQEYLLCTNSGTFNLQTGEIQEANKDDLISMSTNCEISFETPKLFTKFLNDMFPSSPDIIHYLQKAFGYSITNSAREQCMFILHGDGNNGKSLLLDVIKNALGSYGITSKPQLLTEQKYSTTNSEEIARLKGKRFVAVEEIKMGDKLDEQLIKSLTSGIGNQVARFLYGSSFEFPFKGKIWLSTNYEPVITGTDKGIWRRIIKIPVNVDFTGREDKDLREKLLKELPEILGWIIQGYKMYKEEGLETPKEIKDATNAYRKEMDIVQQWVDDYCEINDEYFEKANILYDNFKVFCQRRDQRTNQTAFGRNLSKKFEKVHSSSGIIYLGLRLKKEAKELTKRELYDRIAIKENI